MMSIRKKGMILAVAALFLSLSMAPAITAEKETTEPVYAVELTSVAENGQFIQETMYLTSEEVQVLQNRLSWLLDLLKNQMDMEGLLELLLQFINLDDYPILSRIITTVFDSELLLKGKLVVSEGWGIDINPFKDSQTSFMKPITVWKYQAASEMFQLPSMTAIVDLNPFALKTIEGGQLGMMLRFKGIYVHISQPLPQQSFTFILGMSRFATAFEMPTVTLPPGLTS